MIVLASSVAACGGAAPATHAERAPVAPTPAEPEATETPYEAELVAQEIGDMEPFAVEELTAGSRAVHLVLDAAHCYRIVAVGERHVSLELVDEHGNSLAAREGRIVRFESVCPRWSGSFELRVDLDGARGRVSLYEDDALASDGSSGPASSTTR